MFSLEFGVVVKIKQFNISTPENQGKTVQVQFVDIFHLLLVRPPPAANISLGAGFLFSCDDARLSRNRKDNC